MMKPGHRNRTDCDDGWTLEDEIAWLEFYIQLNTRVLNKLYEERDWWKRFIDYCNNKSTS
jgi:hypothetical protein